MRKVVVFDSGQGGEIFADKLEAELPVIEVIRVIDWREAERILKNPRLARRAAEDALRPYIGTVDLIIFANQLLTLTSLRYFRRKYRGQAFLGLGLETPSDPRRKTAIFTTHAVSKTLYYRCFVLKMRGKIYTICLDEWPDMIDEGELTSLMARNEMEKYMATFDGKPGQIILGCSHFGELKNDMRMVFGGNVKICDDVEETIRDIYKVLGIKGLKKKK